MWRTDIILKRSPDGKHFDSMRKAMVHMKTNHYKCHDMSASLWNVKGLYGEDWQQGPILPSDWFFRLKSRVS